MLALAELDTYNILERYARHPDSAFMRACMNVLYKRAVNRVLWDVTVNTRSKEGLAPLVDIRMGVREHPAGEQEQVRSKDIGSLSPEEQKKFYLQACAAGGFSIDPSIFEGGPENKT